MKPAKLISALLIAFAHMPHAQSQIQVVGFDEFTVPTFISGSSYADLIWETGNGGFPFGWYVPASDSINYPHSGSHNVMNFMGSTLTGIRFPLVVNVQGAYIAAQGDIGSWTAGVQVHVYSNGLEIQTTDWFNDIDTHPDWFAMNLAGVDRIVIECKNDGLGGAMFGLDDLTYAVPEPSSLSLLLLATVCCKRRLFA